MRTRWRMMAAVAALGPVTWGAAAMAAERLEVPQLPGWQVVNSVSDHTGEVTELIPPGETADSWTRRVTVQAFRGVPMTVSGFLDQVVQKTAEVCEGATAGPPSMGKVSGADAGTRTVACGQYKGDGRGTFAMHFVVRGREALYVVTRLWRGAPFNPKTMPIDAAELRDWGDYAAGINLCDSRDPNRPCR